MSTKISIHKRLLLNLYVNQELSSYKIAQKLGCSQSYVYNSLVRSKIPIMSNSQRYKGKPRRPHTKESRRKMSLSKLGSNNPAKRLEVRAKISKANKGRKHSEEAKKNMSKAQKGRIIKWGDKIAVVKKKWYASKSGQEFIKKLSQRKGSNNPMFNKSEKIAERHWTKICSQDVKDAIIKRFREIRLRQKFPLKFSKIEIILGNEIKKRGIYFLTHQPLLNICQPDIIMPNYKLVIQCDGDWWHVNPRFYRNKPLSKIQKNNAKRDKWQDAILNNNGWHVMRFWGSDIKDNVLGCVDKIEKFINRKGK